MVHSELTGFNSTGFLMWILGLFELMAASVCRLNICVPLKRLHSLLTPPQESAHTAATLTRSVPGCALPL